MGSRVFQHTGGGESRFCVIEMNDRHDDLHVGSIIRHSCDCYGFISPDNKGSQSMQVLQLLTLLCMGSLRETESEQASW